MKKFLLLIVALFASISMWAIEQDSEGYYLIGSAQDWDDFAAIVNNTNQSANAKMTADVDLGDDQTHIGYTSNNRYRGVFDGDGHKLTVNYNSSDYGLAPFRYTAGATIKDLHIDGSIISTYRPESHTSGVISHSRGADVISNVWVSVEIQSGGAGWIECAAFIGCNNSGNSSITDCLFTGSMKTTSGYYNGCFFGYSDSGTVTVSNCLSTGTFDYYGGSTYVESHGGVFNNCYVKQFPSTIPTSMQCTDEQLSDGTIATALQAGRTEEVWVQDETTGAPMLKIFLQEDTPLSHDCVDLGLPSGTLWATTNIGAANPEDFGDYFAWGETQPKDVYDWSTYMWCNGNNNFALTKYNNDSSHGNNGFVDNKTELDPEDDAATANWGSEWRMPSLEQIQELLNNCTTQWTAINGVNGRLLTSTINGETLFLPANGYLDGSTFNGGSGNYWSRTLDTSFSPQAYYLNFGSSLVRTYSLGRQYGFSVRAVRYMTYSITLPESFENGMVTCDKESATEGETVTLTVTPDENYELESLTITTVDGNEPSGAPMLAPRRANVDYNAGENGTYTFLMPAAPVTVNATFKETTFTGLIDLDAAQPKSGQRYNLMGQPVGKDYKGIVIEDGKKLIVR